MAKGKSLVVGVSQPLPSSGWNASRLSGVDDDCRNMETFLRKDCHFDVDVLQEGDATHDAVLAKIKASRDTLEKGDFFVFVYSGHGGFRTDADGDEDDRQDELLLTHDKPIVDDELAELWSGFAQGVRVLTVMDACHSGTMARKATPRGEVREIVPSLARPFMLGLPRTGPGDAFNSTRESSTGIQASLIHLSACRDEQTAADTSLGGAFTLALLRAMSAPPPRDYDRLHVEIKKHLGSRRQISELLTFGLHTGAFRAQQPFKIHYLSDEQIAAAAALEERIEDAWGLRSASIGKTGPASHGIILSRPPKHRLDLVLNGNSITEVRAKAYVLGLFEGVTPAGPAGAIDELLGGTIRDLVSRRMVSARVGEVFMVPTGNAPIPSDVLLFVGLGQLDQFLSKPQEVQKFIAGNIIRTLVQVGIDEFATVLIGGGSGQTVPETLSSLVHGFVAGLRDADPGDRARRVILCENDADRYAEMVDLVYSYARSAAFEDIGLTVYERPPQTPSRQRQMAPPALADFRSRMFLSVRHQSVDGEDSYESILLMPGGKATAIPSSMPYERDERDALLQSIGGGKFKAEKFGTELAKFVLSDEFIEILSGPMAEGQHLIVVHDAESSKLPWETLRCGKRTLALDGGLSRKYLLSGNYSVAKWLEKRRFDRTLDILLVVNPTEDLSGAEREGKIIRQLIKDIPSVNITEIGGKAATRERLLGEFQSGAYDVIHYAGHAGFDKAEPSKSGILCSGEKVLSGADLATIGDLPALVFFNACESGRIRKAPRPINRLQESVSFAEAFLRGGIANFIGTYWPVGDDSAEAFAKTFYGGIVSGQAIGDALIAGRQVVQKSGSVDWADYIHYGDPDFHIKEGTGSK